MSEQHEPVTERPGPGQAPIGGDDRDAGRALEGLLFGGDDGSGADESAPTGEESEGQTEPPAKPAAIEPPRSWSAEDRAVFSRLPPEAQAVVARRESERESAFTKRTQEIAEERKGWDAERAAIATQRQTYVQNLQQMLSVAFPEAQQLAQVDWATLSAQNPSEYVRLSGMRDAVLGRIGQIQQAVVQAQQQAESERQKAFAQIVSAERAKLTERIPDFGDVAKATAMVRDIKGFLHERYGFAEGELDHIADHRMVALAHDAMTAHRTAQAAAAAQGKRANTPPKVQQPGAAAGTDRTADQQVRGLIGQLGRTNSMRDAGKLLESIL